MKKIAIFTLSLGLSVSLISPSFASASQIENKPVTTKVVSTQATGGYQYVTSFKTTASAYKNSAYVGLGMIGFMGGAGAVTAGIAGTAGTLFTGYGNKEVYIEIVQYYNPSTHFLKETYNYYSNSNYTGLLKSGTSEHRLWS